MVGDLVEAYLQSRPVVAFVSVLEQVLDRANRGHDFHIDVRSIFSGEERVVWHNIPAVHDVAILLNGPARVAATVNGVDRLRHCSGFAEFTRVALTALPAFHARSRWVSDAAWAVHMAPRDDVQELGRIRVIGIWKLRANAGIYVGRRPRLVGGSDDEQDVGVGQAALLKLNNPSPKPTTQRPMPNNEGLVSDII